MAARLLTKEAFGATRQLARERPYCALPANAATSPPPLQDCAAHTPAKETGLGTVTKRPGRPDAPPRHADSSACTKNGAPFGAYREATKGAPRGCCAGQTDLAREEKVEREEFVPQGPDSNESKRHKLSNPAQGRTQPGASQESDAAEPCTMGVGIGSQSP